MSWWTWIAGLLVACVGGGAAVDVDGDVDGDTNAPACASADVVRQAALAAVGDAAHEVYANGTCPLRRIDASRVWEPTVECRQFEECGCRARAGECHTNADCTEHPNGMCVGVESDGNTIRYAVCLYETCLSDAECAVDQACACSPLGHRICVNANCRTDADCGTGHQCLRTLDCGSSVPRGDFLCTTDADGCLTHDDCRNSELGATCIRSGDHRICSNALCGD